MKWKELPLACKTYLVLVYCLAIPVAFLCFADSGSYLWSWFLLTVASVFVAAIHLNLPQLPAVVISMGDVFTILALIEFGPGPALITYWANVVATALARRIGQNGWRSLKNFVWHRLLFNASCCALSIFAMQFVYARSVTWLPPEHAVLALASVAAVWFVVNTVTLSIAISLSSRKSFLLVWKQGIGLYLLNFFGSAGAAGLISKFY